MFGYEKRIDKGENPLYVTREQEKEGRTPDFGEDSALWQETESENDKIDEQAPQDRETTIFDLRDALAVSQKGGKKGKSDSDKFKAVNMAILQIQAFEATNPFGSEKASDDIKKLHVIMEHYNILLGACDDYLSRRAFTSTGKARQKIVKEIRALAKQDAAGFGKAMDEVSGSSESDRKSLSWDNILKISRREHYEPAELKNSSTGQASEVYKFDNPDTSSKAKKLFFKPEVIFDTTGNPAMWCLSQYKNLHPDEAIDPKLVAFMKTCVMDTGTIYGFENGNRRDVQPSEFGDPESMTTIMKNMDVLHGEFYSHTGMQNTGVQDVTGRNVATSRVADLLGVGHIVARSKFADVKDPNTGKTRRGIVMEGAEGTQGSIVETKISNRINNIPDENPDEPYQPPENMIYTKEAIEYQQGANEIFQPSFIKDITNLQILDSICGQMDRHDGNMFFKTDKEGRLTGVTGIDNDSAFTKTTLSLSHMNETRRDRDSFDENGNLVIPYVDADMAAHIKALSPEALRFALTDLLNPDIIDATVKRLELMKKAVEGADESKIISGDRWGDPAVRKNLVAKNTQANSRKESADTNDYLAAQEKELDAEFGDHFVNRVKPKKRAAFEQRRKEQVRKQNRRRGDLTANRTYLGEIMDSMRF